MKNVKTAVSVEEALDIVLSSATPLGYEDVSILEAFDRILYEDIVSDRLIPPCNEAAMDGYAIFADDSKGASQIVPVRLKLIGEIRPGGSSFGGQAQKGTAIRIMTGAPMPEGTNSVIPLEETEEDDSYVKIFRETLKFENRRSAGENIKKGDKVLHKGDRLRSADIGILASLDCITVKVYKPPTVTIFSTGDELADAGESIQNGQIRNVNAYTLYSEIKKYNALPKYLGIARDTLKDTKEILLRALESDVVISTGGVSKGKYDFVKQIFSDFGIEILFEQVNVKPGTPCVFGRKGNKLIFGLPGNPVPTLTSFMQFVRPALLRLMGARRINKPIINATLEEDISSGKIHNLLRGHFTIKNNEFYVTTTGNQKPSVLRSMSAANCLIVVPENITKIRAGEKVAVQLINHDEI